MVVAFSGSRRGLTKACEARLRKHIKELHDSYKIEWGVHGDCLGGDETFHKIMREMGIKIEIHPPDNPKLRAFLEGDVIMKELPYLNRNVNICKRATTAVACPDSMSRGTRHVMNVCGRMRMDCLVIDTDGRASWQQIGK